MSVLAELLADCDAHGIRLLPDGEDGLTIDAPRDALTPDLVERLKAHKGALLATLRPEAGAPVVDPPHAAAVWHAALDRLESDPMFPSNVMKSLWAADVQWKDETVWENSIEPPDPCPECGTLELWQTLAGNWRCLRCDPPTKARRLLELAARLKLTAQDRPG